LFILKKTKPNIVNYQNPPPPPPPKKKKKFLKQKIEYIFRLKCLIDFTLNVHLCKIERENL
jgi:hypothetical protein